jgi:hypothetical protein
MNRDAIVFPNNTGFLLARNSYSTIYMQITYNDSTNDAIDSSGIRIFYTTQAMAHSVGVVALGNPLSQEVDSLGQLPVNYETECPSDCTSKWNQNKITVFAVYNHAPQTVSRILTTHWSPVTFSIKLFSQHYRIRW